MSEEPTINVIRIILKGEDGTEIETETEWDMLCVSARFKYALKNNEPLEIISVKGNLLMIDPKEIAVLLMRKQGDEVDEYGE